MSLHQGPARRHRIAALTLAAAVLLALACSGDDDGPDITATVPPPANTAMATLSATNSPPAGQPSPATPTPSPVPLPETPISGLVPVKVQRVFENLSFERMTGLYQDSEGYWYVTEQAGLIHRIDPNTGDSALWLDIVENVDDSATEMGLLGFALAPDFEISHEFYVDYTGGGQTVVSRFNASADHLSADPESEHILLTVDQPFANHNGGQIAFGPDGYLYIALGDGGGSDPEGNGQNPGALLGSILRIDVAGGEEYTIPEDNPLVGQSGVREEVWAYGFRNPWRFSFDRETGELWVGDVGQRSREEIDLVVGGGNYGWSVMEGFQCRGGGNDCNSEGMLPPVFDYPTGSGGTCAVTGGFVYRGTAIPGLRGAYVFSDYCSGAVYALRAVDGVLTEHAELASPGLSVSSLAEDNDGELYLLDLSGGGIYKLVP